MMLEAVASVATAVALGGSTAAVVRPVARLAARVRPHVAGLAGTVSVRGWSAAGLAGGLRGRAGAATAGAVVGGGVGVAVSVAAGWEGPGRWVMAGLGAVAGGSRPFGRAERELEGRRARMVAELATVNQLLAVRVRTGGSVHQALAWLSGRVDGLVAGELRRALGSAEAGLPLAEALRIASRSTDEPACARTYLLLAAADERGVDLALELVRVADDVREKRRIALRRRAAGRRAAMLVPIVAVLAPVMLLFVGAPLPTLFLSP